MATLIHASCSSCNIDRRFSFGANRSQFSEGTVMIPFLDKLENKLIILDISKPYDQSRLVPYTDASMYAGEIKDFNGTQHVQHWIKTEGNYCPLCKTFTMTFYPYGLSD